MCAPTEFNLKRLAVLPFREVGLKNDTTQLLSGFTEDLSLAAVLQQQINYDILSHSHKKPYRTKSLWEFFGWERIIKEEAIYRLSFDGEHFNSKKTKGLIDLIKLIEQPEKEFHCNDLMWVGIKDSNIELTDTKKSKEDYKKRILVLSRYRRYRTHER